MTSRTAVIDFLAALDDDELDELLTEARDVTDEKAPKRKSSKGGSAGKAEAERRFGTK
ncbi:hypothetical protein J6397_30200 [Rhodococcus qingshengii]|uniref:hypothetical protein n=1 Tax=Rhodococcus qingshengii TaxID=334542 RepID=UPI001AEA307F|nr:hypothetical protein [Rhodococcus qingshengii]MBP1054423.1 hypothetical protein [Rhodococcus qingshengii]